MTTRPKKQRNGKPFKASDEKYVDEHFMNCLKSIQTATNTTIYLPSLRKQFKEFFVVFLMRAIGRSTNKKVHFYYVAPIIKCAEKNKQGAHFVNCVFDTLNSVQKIDYIPKSRYGITATKGPAFRDGLQRILKDATYTARKHFSKLKEYAEHETACINDLVEIEEGMVFLSKLFKFYYTKQIPHSLPIALFEEAKANGLKIDSFYELSGNRTQVIRKNCKREYGAISVFGEEIASFLFVHLYK